MRSLLLSLALIPTLCASAQKYEQKLNERLQPTVNGARYYAITEKKDSLWHRTVMYLPGMTPAMEGWYKDKEGKFPHGDFTAFHLKGTVKAKGTYVNGQKQDTWLEYDPKGRLRDSATYADGKLRGTRLQWFDNGQLMDSTEFDWAGNGVQVSWYKDGTLKSAGYWVKDSLKRGRWQYFHRNGELQAVEEYKEGKLAGNACFDSTGKRLESCEEREPSFAGGVQEWRRYLERNLDAGVPVKKGAPSGTYTVVVQFTVNTDGSIEDVKALTHHGYGMEEEVERLIKKGPRWSPGRRFGALVKSLRRQPVTFVVTQDKPLFKEPVDPMDF